MRPYKLSDIANIKTKGVTVNVDPIIKNRVVIPRGDSIQVVWMFWQLKIFCQENNLTLEKEYHFDPERKWRSDFAILEPKILIEFEGGIYNPNGDHRSVKGISRDIDKYNSAERLGWRVQRYSAKNYKQVLQDLKEFL